MAARPGSSWTKDDFDYIGMPQEKRYDDWGTAEILNEHRSGIATGLAREKISELGPLHRQLLQESDYFAAGRTLLKKLSPEEENERFEFDGGRLPEELQEVLLSLDDMGLGTSTLKSTIRLAGEDKATLEWITDNWETFLETKPEDALAHADNGLIEIKDTEDFSIIPIQEPLESNSGYAKDSYRVVEVFKKSNFKEASERRLVHLKRKIYSIKERNHPKELEHELWSIRESYEEDRKLIQQWSQAQQVEERALYLNGLHKRRRKLEILRELERTKAVMDFETIRRKTWFCFDKKREEKIVEAISSPLKGGWTEHVNPKTGVINPEGFMSEEECKDLIKRGKPDPRKFIKEKVVTTPSLWETEKSKDFCNLHQTRSQWNQVYARLWQKMNETIIWRLNQMRRVDEGLELAEYIRRFQFRLDAEQLGQVILNKARKAQTNRGKNVIRSLLASCQYQLDEDTKDLIVKEICRRNK